MKLSKYYKSLSKKEKHDFLLAICKSCKIKISQARHFVYGTRRVTSHHCKKISQLTNNTVKTKDIRPDIY